MLYIVGLGLGDEKDITVKGLEAVKRCSKVYLEAYTSILLADKGKLEELYGCQVSVADREMVEQGIESVLQEALNTDVAFLVVGDPFGATTHTDLLLRAHKLGVSVKVVHNASIMNAIGACGLQLYRFGETISIPFFTDTWRPDSFYDKIKLNQSMGLHTLCLLDIRVKEPSMEGLARGKIIYEPPLFMSVNTAVEQLLEIEERRKEGVCVSSSQGIGVARLGTDSQMIVSGTLEELRHVDFGPPLHSLVLPGSVHVIEAEMMELFQITDQSPRVADQKGYDDGEDDEGSDYV